MKYDEFRAMNSNIVVAADGTDATVIAQGFDRTRKFISESEQRFTRFSETSELAELNRSAGNPFQASDEMFEVLQTAQRLAMDTQGLFNPGILPELKKLGYNRSMDELRKQDPEGPAYATQDVEVITKQDFREIQLDNDTNTVKLPKEMQIDLGGIAKGWIAEQAALRLAESCQACGVNAGGDMFLVNLPHGERTWEVGLENPINPEVDLAILHVKPGAVATSSTVKRQWKHNGRLQHHLIDPRSGKPAETDWLSVTVWAKEAATAEVYAKVLLIAGPRFANELIECQPDLAYLAVDKYSWVSGSSNYHEVFHV